MKYRGGRPIKNNNNNNNSKKDNKLNQDEHIENDGGTTKLS